MTTENETNIVFIFDLLILLGWAGGIIAAVVIGGYNSQQVATGVALSGLGIVLWALLTAGIERKLPLA
jgi:hypothetical protein